MTDVDAARERLSVVREARERVAAARAAREALAERRAALPAAVCRVCGCRIPAGEGDREAEPEFAEPRDRIEHRGKTASLPAEVDAWRRRCTSCADAAEHGEAEALAVSGILGDRIAQADARAVVAALRSWALEPATGEATRPVTALPTAEATGRYGREAWEHVRDDERERVREALRGVRAQRAAGRCVAGPCGLCGRSHAVRWYASRLRWANGAQAPVCDECWPAYERRGEPREGEQLRALVFELVTGWALPVGIGPGDDVRAYCESRAAGDLTARRTPWAYAPEAIADLRREVWAARPHLAPPEYRDAALAWHAEAEAERAEADARARETATRSSW